MLMLLANIIKAIVELNYLQGKMRKIGFYLLILLAMVMVISCGNDKKSDKEENAASEKVETEEGEEEADADPAPDLSKTVNVVRVTGTLALDPQNKAVGFSH